MFFQGAQPLTAQSSLCEITCTDGCKYVMLCGMKGQLLEINDNLKSNPHLVTEKVFLLVVFYFIGSPSGEGSAVALWLMTRAPDREVGGLSPTRAKPCCVLEQDTFTPRKYW